MSGDKPQLRMIAHYLHLGLCISAPAATNNRTILVTHFALRRTARDVYRPAVHF